MWVSNSLINRLGKSMVIAIGLIHVDLREVKKGGSSFVRLRRWED